MFKKIPPDKWKHFFTGIVMGAVLQMAALLLFPGLRDLATLIVFGLVVGISYGFELFSLLSGKGHHDVMDAVASIAGGVVGMLAELAVL